jgi:ABC-type uncharacterized transport system permease subunit
MHGQNIKNGLLKIYNIILLKYACFIVCVRIMKRRLRPAVESKVIVAILSEPNLIHLTIAKNIIQYIISETIQFLFSKNQHNNNPKPNKNPKISIYLI